MNMKVETLINELKTNRIAVVAEKVGLNAKTISKALKTAGYEYHRKGGAGWQYTSTSEPPLKRDIQEFITTTDSNSAPKNTKKEDENKVLTTHDMKVLHEIIKEWETAKEVVDKTTKRHNESEAESSQKLEQPIHALYVRIKEIESKERLRKTLSLGKDTCATLDSFTDKYHLNAEDVIELALNDFFAKISEYKA